MRTWRRVGVLAAALAAAACATVGREPPRPEHLPPGYAIEARADLNGDGREDVVLADAQDCGAMGCRHAVAIGRPGRMDVATFVREQVEESNRGEHVYCNTLKVAAEVSRGYRDLLCSTRVYHEAGRDRAVVRYRWSGTAYVSELAHMVQR